MILDRSVRASLCLPIENKIITPCTLVALLEIDQCVWLKLHVIDRTGHRHFFVHQLQLCDCLFLTAEKRGNKAGPTRLNINQTIRQLIAKAMVMTKYPGLQEWNCNDVIHQRIYKWRKTTHAYLERRHRVAISLLCPPPYQGEAMSNTFNSAEDVVFFSLIVFFHPFISSSKTTF